MRSFAMLRKSTSVISEWCKNLSSFVSGQSDLGGAQYTYPCLRFVSQAFQRLAEDELLCCGCQTGVLFNSSAESTRIATVNIANDLRSVSDIERKTSCYVKHPCGNDRIYHAALLRQLRRDCLNRPSAEILDGQTQKCFQFSLLCPRLGQQDVLNARGGLYYSPNIRWVDLMSVIDNQGDTGTPVRESLVNCTKRVQT